MSNEHDGFLCLPMLRARGARYTNTQPERTGTFAKRTSASLLFVSSAFADDNLMMGLGGSLMTRSFGAAPGAGPQDTAALKLVVWQSAHKLNVIILVCSVLPSDSELSLIFKLFVAAAAFLCLSSELRSPSAISESALPASTDSTPTLHY
jgi:hypothetical protein